MAAAVGKALCWCKEELKSLRYYTSKRTARGFRKKKQAKVFASIYSSQALASQAVVWLRLHCCCQLAKDTKGSAAPLKEDMHIDVHIGRRKALRPKPYMERTLQMRLFLTVLAGSSSTCEFLISSGSLAQQDWRLRCSVASHILTTALVSYGAVDSSWRTSCWKCRNRVIIWEKGHLWRRQV